MINYRNCETNEDFILLPIESINILTHEYRNFIPSSFHKKLEKIYSYAIYSNVPGTYSISEPYLKEFAFKKNSEIGKYIISNSDNINIINQDEFISYEKIVNAINIAMFQDDSRMTNKLLPFFQTRKTGFVNELLTDLNSDAIKYICANKSFETYLRKLDNSYIEPDYYYLEKGKIIKVNEEKLIKRLVKTIKKDNM